MPAQPHTEETIQHTDGQQDTGNHKVPNAPDAHGADRFGGTRAGAENVERTGDGTAERGDSAEHLNERGVEGRLQEPRGR